LFANNLLYESKGEIMLRTLLISFLVLLLTAGIVSAGNDGTAYLVLCRIELLDGEIVEGFVHIGTHYGPKYYYKETNGILVIDDNDRLTRFSFTTSDTRGLRRNEILEINKLRSGYTDAYITPSTYGWADDYKIFFMKDTSLSSGNNRIQRYSVTCDTLSAKKSLTYKYSENVTDQYILLDYFPIFTEIPDSYEGGQFFGGKLINIEFKKIQSFFLRYFKSVSDGKKLLKEKFNYDLDSIIKDNHIKFIITYDQKSFFRQLNFKPSWVYDKSWKLD
jgi:hypothetical protein